MMGDFVDHHVAHQPEQVLPGFDPFQQDRLPVEEDQVGLAHRVRHATLCQRGAAIEAGQFPGGLDIEFVQGFLVGHVLDRDADAVHVAGEPQRDRGKRTLRHVCDVVDGRRQAERGDWIAQIAHTAIRCYGNAAGSSRRDTGSNRWSPLCQKN